MLIIVCIDGTMQYFQDVIDFIQNTVKTCNKRCIICDDELEYHVCCSCHHTDDDID